MGSKGNKPLFRCLNCGYESGKWLGKCPECGSWNSFEESIPAQKNLLHALKTPEILPLSAITLDEEKRLVTPILEWDRVLGGGLVPGSLVLLAGDPGIGKSTLILQILASFASKKKVLYVTGEESPRQIKLRAERLKVAHSNILIASETSLEVILELAESNKIDILAIDSIQTISSSLLDATAGTVAQVRYCTDRLLQASKMKTLTTIIVGHVTKEGAIAGPKTLEHLVDVVLYLEGDKTHSFRLLRTVKNRYGSTNEIGVFEMKEDGLYEVSNPSQVLLAERPIDVPGSVVMATVEGSRPILVEVQALTSYSSLNLPRRTTIGFDAGRASLLLAVIEKRLGLSFAQEDVFINVAGGIKLREPAADLAICLALISTSLGKPVPSNLVAWGEVGLTGEIRSVGHSSMRFREATRLGFNMILVPSATAEQLRTASKISGGITLLEIKSLKEVIDRIF